MPTKNKQDTAPKQNETPSLDTNSRLEEAQAIVKNNVKWAAGIGVVPIPIVDLVGIFTVQIRMLRRLSELYEIPFMEHKVKNLLSALLVGGGSVKLGLAAALGFMKFIPVVGTTLGLVSVPIVAGALTHATGQVFIGHFESGGNFLDFEPAKARAHFRQEFESAQDDLKTKVNKA